MNNAPELISREIQIFERISQVEKHKSDNDKKVRLAEIAMAEKTAALEIKNKSHNLEQEKEFRLSNNKSRNWLIVFGVLSLIATIMFLVGNNHSELATPILSFVLGGLGGFGYGKSR